MNTIDTDERIGETTFGLPTDHDLAITRTFAAPARLIFDIWTKPEHLPHWMLGPDKWTMTICEVDLRPGGAWRFGWRRDDGTEMAMDGEYLEVDRPRRVVSTERWGGEWAETVNTLELVERDGQTTITSTMHYPSTAARDAVLKSGMKQGVAKSFDRLAQYLRTLA